MSLAWQLVHEQALHPSAGHFMVASPVSQHPPFFLAKNVARIASPIKTSTIARITQLAKFIDPILSDKRLKGKAGPPLQFGSHYAATAAGSTASVCSLGIGRNKPIRINTINAMATTVPMPNAPVTASLPIW